MEKRRGFTPETISGFSAENTPEENLQKKTEEMDRREFLKRSFFSLLGIASANSACTPIFRRTERRLSSIEEERGKGGEMGQRAIDVCIENIKEDKNLREQCGDEIIDRFAESFSRINLNQIHEMVFLMCGEDSDLKERLAQQPLRSMEVCDNNRWKVLKGESLASAFYENGAIHIRASAYSHKEDGELGCFLHEYSHHLTCKSGEEGKTVVLWNEDGGRHDLYEGSTEIMSIVLMDRLYNEKDSRSSYQLGAAMSAFSLRVLAGSETFDKAFFTGNFSEIEKKIDGIFGEGVSGNILGAPHNLFNRLDSSWNDVELLHEIFTLCKSRSIEPRRLVEEAKSFGLTEALEIIDNSQESVEGLVYFIYDENGNLTGVNGVVGDVGEPLFENAPQLRVHITANPNHKTETNDWGMLEQAVRYISENKKQLIEARQKLEPYLTDYNNEINASARDSLVKRVKTLRGILKSSCTLTLSGNPEGRYGDLLFKYNLAQSEEEKDKIKEEIIQKIQNDSGMILGGLKTKYNAEKPH